jgi:hypothetical protein
VDCPFADAFNVGQLANNLGIALIGDSVKLDAAI